MAPNAMRRSHVQCIVTGMKLEGGVVADAGSCQDLIPSRTHIGGVAGQAANAVGVALRARALCLGGRVGTR